MVNLDNSDKHGSILNSRALRFVVKFPLATSGYGTWLTTTEARPQGILKAMTRFEARGSKEVLVSEYLNVKQDLSAHVVVKAKGDITDRDNPLLVAVTVQNLTTRGHWTGGSIDYPAQSTLKSLLWETVLQTTGLLPESFVGWAGLDIVVDEEGKQCVVDLKPRFTSSIPICLIANHFFEQRGLPLAEFAAFRYAGASEDLYTILLSEIWSGKVVINAMTSISEGSNMVNSVWSGRDRKHLVKTAKSIKLKLRGK